MPESGRSASTVVAMVRWLPRIVALVTLVGLLTMHGLDATATAAHETHGPAATEVHPSHDAPAFASQSGIVERSPAPSDSHRSLHHVAIACVFALVTAAVLGIRRLLLRLARQAIGVVMAAAVTVAATFEAIWRPPQPVWVRFCVIRH